MEIGAHTPAYVSPINLPGSREGDVTPVQPEDEAKSKDPLQDPTSAESRELEKLKQRDREVRAHELAHLAAAGQYAQGGAKFEYQRGPDGQRYAVGGEVSIDTSAIPGDPEATIRKLQAVQRAALAPAEPSGQDRSVAAQAASSIAQARIEVEQQVTSESGDPAASTPAVETDKEESRTTGESGNNGSAGQYQVSNEALQRYQQTATAVDQAQAPILELIA